MGSILAMTRVPENILGRGCNDVPFHGHRCHDLALCLCDLALVDNLLDPVGHLLHLAFPALPALDGGDSEVAKDVLDHILIVHTQHSDNRQG